MNYTQNSSSCPAVFMPLGAVKVFSIAAFGLLFAGVAGAQDLLPGYLTDPNANWKEIRADGYVTPDHLKYPYVSTYYVEPTLNEGDRCKIGCYVTDFDHSLVRFGDKSKRFDVFCRWSSDAGATFQEKKLENVASGDYSFDLGVLPVGEYFVGVKCFDRGRKLESHEVWQEFRVIRKGSLDIPAEKTLKMTKADLEKYGLKNDGTYERIVKLEQDVDPLTLCDNNYRGKVKENNAHYQKVIDKYLAEHPHQDAARPGYAVYVPTWKGVAVDRAYQRSRVVYDSKYDKEAVAAEAEANAVGLQRFVDEAWSNGYRKIVFYPGVYRVNHLHTLTVPDGTTIDLNGATLKMNGFIGCHASMAKIAAVTDSHIVNGTFEGDYWEHDYAAADSKGSEWVCGISIRAMARYCSFENLTVRYITGYGISNGGGNEGPGLMIKDRPFLNVGAWFGMTDGKKKKKGQEVDGMVPGGLRADGTVDGSDTYQWTSPFRDISAFQPWHYLTVGKALGYQGVLTRGWNFVVCFYDENQNFLERRTGFQFRHVLVPPKAKFARFSIEVQGEEEAKKNNLAITLWKSPRNCAVRKCLVDRARAVGICVNNLNNMIFADNVVRQSGECLATCALDAEDGWDQMQDALFIRNDMTENHRCQFLTCAGHNFMIVSNRFNISLHPRTFSPYVRGNVSDSLSFECRNRMRTGYARYIDNTCKGNISLGNGKMDYPGWDVVLEGLTFESPDTNKLRRITGGTTGRFRNCTFRNVLADVGNAENCTFDHAATDCFHRWINGRWTNCRATDCAFGAYQSTNLFVDCTFERCKISAAVARTSRSFERCEFKDCNLPLASRPLPQFHACKGVPPRMSVFLDYITEAEKQTKKLNFGRFCDDLKKLGVAGFDADAANTNQFQHAIKKGLHLVNLYGHIRFLSEDGGRADGEQLLAVARKFDAPRIMVLPDDLPDTKDKAKIKEAFVKIRDGLKTFVAEANRAGFEVTVEDFGSPRSPCARIKTMKALVDAIPTLKVTLDSGNFHFAGNGKGDDILEAYKVFKDRISHVHFKDYRNSAPRQYCPLGEGDLPNEKLLKLLLADNYNGFITIEESNAPEFSKAIPAAATKLGGWIKAGR